MVPGRSGNEAASRLQETGPALGAHDGCLNRTMGRILRWSPATISAKLAPLLTNSPCSFRPFQCAACSSVLYPRAAGWLRS